MKTIELTCALCGEVFAKDFREYKRQIKRDRTEFFCSRSCATSQSNKDNPRPGNPENLKSDNRRDKYTPFRWYVLRAEYRDRKKKYGCDLDVDYLKFLWDSQNGLCPFTGWSLILPRDTDGWIEYHPHNASLDRIDCALGYVKGNVRFVSVIANLARSTFTDEQLIDFCKAVAIKGN